MKNRKVAGSEMNGNSSRRSRHWHDHWSNKSEYCSEVIPREWELSTTLNCYKGKGDALDGENYRGLKLKHQILKFIKQRVDVDRCSLVWCPDLELKAPFLFWDSSRKNIYLAKTRICTLNLPIWRKYWLRKPRNTVWWVWEN